MQNRGGIARLIISCVCCLTVVLYSGYGYLSGKFAAAVPADSDAHMSIPTDSQNGAAASDITSDSNPPDPDDDQSETQSDTSQAVSAGSQGTAIGKVTERFITPYTANTSYNSVYLKNSTNLPIDIKSLLNAALPYKIVKNDQPQVLIMHTHTTECYLPEARDYYTDADVSRTLDENYNVVRLGNIVTDKLNAAGIKTLHDKTTHDYPAYDGSYDRAAETIRAYLKKYPSIHIVIDMHRDAIGDGADKVKTVTEINGKKAAQIMLVMGSQSGSVTNFPNWQENLKLAVRLQQTVESMYPTLARSLSLMPRNYNESLTTGSLLIETGTDANSIEEATYSAELLGNALVKLLNTLG